MVHLSGQIENKKRGFHRQQYKSNKLVKPWVKASSSTAYNTYSNVNSAKHWHKPAMTNVPMGQSGSLTHFKPSLKSLKVEHQHSSESSLVTGNVTQKPNQVFINPNFVPPKAGSSVHINPKFQSHPAVIHPAKAQSLAQLADRSAAAAPLLAAHTPAPLVVHPSVTRTAPAAGISGVTSLPITSLPGPSLASAAPTGRVRRRSLSRYRLLTARKLVRRRSRDAPAPAAGSPRAPTPARKLVSTRHKLVRVASTPRTQQLLDRQAIKTGEEVLRVKLLVRVGR